MSQYLTLYELNLSKIQKENKDIFENNVFYSDDSEVFVDNLKNALKSFPEEGYYVEKKKRSMKRPQVYKKDERYNGRPVRCIYGLADSGISGESSMIEISTGGIFEKTPPDTEYSPIYYCFAFVKNSDKCFLALQSDNRRNITDAMRGWIKEHIDNAYSCKSKVEMKVTMPESMIEEYMQSEVSNLVFTKDTIRRDELEGIYADKANNVKSAKKSIKTVSYSVEGSKLREFFSRFKKQGAKYKNVSFLDFEPDDIKATITTPSGKKKVVKISDISNPSRFKMDVGGEVELDDKGHVALESMHSWVVSYLEYFI